MISRNVVIGIGILVFVGLGLMFMSTITGNVITGSTAIEEVDVGEPFKISYFGAGENVVSNEVEVEDGA